MCASPSMVLAFWGKVAANLLSTFVHFCRVTFGISLDGVQSIVVSPDMEVKMNLMYDAIMPPQTGLDYARMEDALLRIAGQNPTCCEDSSDRGYAQCLKLCCDLHQRFILRQRYVYILARSSFRT